MEGVKILLVEDNPDDAELVLHELKKSFPLLETQVICGQSDLRRLITSIRWDAVISDFNLTDFDAFDVLSICRKSGFRPPIIIVTGTIGEEQAASLIKKGAADFISKENLTRLNPAVIREIGLNRTRQTMKSLREQLRMKESQYKHFFTRAPEPILIVNYEMKIVNANKAASDFFGMREDELIESRLNDITRMPMDETELVRFANEKALQVASGELTELEITLFSRSRGPVPVRILATPFHLQGGLNFRVVIQDLTETRKIEKQLRDNEQQMKELFDLAGLGIAKISSEGIWLSMNTGYAAALGYTPDKLTGTSFFNLIPESDKAMQIAHFSRCLKENTGYQGDLMIRKADGTFIRTKHHLIPVHQHDFHERHVIGILENISLDSARRQKILENPEARHLFFQSSREPVITLDDSHRILSWNPAASAFFGYSVTEVENRDINFLFADTNSIGIFLEFLGKPETGNQDCLQTVMKTASGKECEIEISRIPFKIKSKEVKCIFIHDMTEINRTLRHNAMLNRILEETSDFIIAFDRNGKLIYLNNTARQIRETESSVEILDQLKLGPSVMRILSDIRKGNTGPDIFHAEDFLELQTGIRMHCLFVILAPKNNDSREFIAIIARDISEILRSYDDLKKSEEKLHAMQRLEALGNLAGGIAHDFNNLLTVIRGFVDLAQIDLADETKLRDDLDQVAAAADRASLLTKQLLSFSRQDFNPTVVTEVHSGISGLEKILRQLLGEDITLVTENGAEDSRILISSPEFDQIFLNLATNSAYAMKAGGRFLIRTTNLLLNQDNCEQWKPAKPGNYLSIEVADTGSGIPESQLPMIFEPFFTTKPKDIGTGLGLSVVYGIVKKNDGFIFCTSSPGKGTTFQMIFPVTTELSPADQKITEKADLHSGVSRNILLVEDEDAVRNLALRYLTEAGFNVISRENGKKALQYLEDTEDQIDIILTDVVMPEMGGVALAEEAKFLYPDCRIVYMSGYTDDILLRKGVQFGSVKLVPKPFNRQDLLKALN